MRKIYHILCSLAFLWAGLGNTRPALAETSATITVTTTSDSIAVDGQCSLREAILAANTNSAYNDCAAGAGTDTIQFDAGLALPAVFSLSIAGANENSTLTGDLDIEGTLTINGAGSSNTILDGNQIDRLVDVKAGGRVTLNNLTLQNGNPGAAALGGGASIAATGRLTLNNVVVSNNSAAAGGGVFGNGLLTASNSSFTGNTGGGIKIDAGLLSLTGVQVLNNSGNFGVTSTNNAVMEFSGGEVSGNQGGGILNSNGSDATLTNLLVSGNTGGSGVHNTGTGNTSLTLSSSTIENNTAPSGGGVRNEGIGAVATITQTSLRYNSVTAAGGGVNNSGSMTIDRSTLDHNDARSGGGIDQTGASLTLTNVTISHNSVSDNGGGLHNRTSLVMTNVTVYSNASSGADTGGNIYNDGDSASISLRNTIIAAGVAGGNCFNNLGLINSLGGNLEDAASCGLTGPGDLSNLDPQLGVLQNNGGLTETHALPEGSPAVETGSNTGCPVIDQRGVARPQGLYCDIGAYELILSNQADLSLTKMDQVDPVYVGDLITYTLTVSNAGPNSAPNTVLTDPLPGGLSFASATSSQGTCSHAVQTVTCNLDTIASGAGATVTLVTLATSSGQKSNTASVSSGAVDPNPTNNSASATTTVNIYVPQADLALSMVDVLDPVQSGDPITYTLTIQNSGPDAAQNISLSDNVPVETTFATATPAQGTCSYASGVVSCNLGTLAASASTTVEVVVSAGVAGLVTNQASVSSTTQDPGMGNNSTSSSTTVLLPPETHHLYLPVLLNLITN